MISYMDKIRFGSRFHGPDVEFKLRLKLGSEKCKKLLEMSKKHKRVTHYITKAGFVLIGGYVEQASDLGKLLLKKVRV